MHFNTDQQRVYNACTNEDSNIFCTGEGGTGKSWLLSNIVNTFRTSEKYKERSVAITASTGLAAFNISGITLHSFAGVQIIENDINEMIKRSRRGQSYANWIDTDILIIDEISMISATFFDNLSLVAKDLRKSDKPFGGIRLIMFGDFLQLPPVSKNNTKINKVFEGIAWRSMSVKCFLLTEIIRQSDVTFKNILSSFRVGICNNDADAYMKKLSRNLEYNDDIKPVKLFPLRNSVEDYNKQKLDLIKSQSHTYHAIDYGDHNILKQCIAPKSITLKTGAQVMIIRNLSGGIAVNGSLGTITGFEYSMNNKMLHPIVSLITGSGTNTSITIDLHSWESVMPNGYKVIARRTQIPVILAWATTIHKSQGQTIPRLSIDLDGVFEYGQAYVALSRAVDSSNLQVENFTKGKIKADPESVKFYDRLREEINNNISESGVIVNKERHKIFIGFSD